MRKAIFVKGKRLAAMLLLGTLICGAMAFGGCSKKKEDSNATKETSMIENARELKLKYDWNKTYQKMEGFGASGAWWSQMVGGWVKEQDNSLETREYIAQLLFDKEKGIGLNTFRYNIGAGSADSGNGDISDPWRRAESFETAPGVYDFSKDANAVWFMKKAVELGVTDVVMFANSPLERLTISGNAHGDAKSESKSNLAPENYEAYAKYFLDVVEHFVQDGVPVKFISPINEPQWEWTSGQEGCHYTPEEVVAFLKVFIKAKEERAALKEVEVTAPESGEWGNTNYKYMEAILGDEFLSNYFTSIDNHSYWSDAKAKIDFKAWLNKQGFGAMKLRTSEWCEMVNGTDYSMDSAINLAKEITMDLTELDVVSWQYWIAVSCYNYRDGLMYVTKSNEIVAPTKRLWAMGNFSKFVKVGYERYDISEIEGTIDACGFLSEDKKEEVIIITNSGKENRKLEAFDKPVKIYVTDKNHNLEDVTATALEKGYILIGAESVTTLVYQGAEDASEI